MLTSAECRQRAEQKSPRPNSALGAKDRADAECWMFLSVLRQCLKSGMRQPSRLS